MELTEKARFALQNRSIKLRVVRSGMYQQMTFHVKMVEYSGITFMELFTERVIDMSELLRLAEEIKLPVESQNGRAFPKGTGAKDFSGLEGPSA